MNFGPGYSDLILNAFFRGVLGTPPSTVYFSLAQYQNPVTVPVEISGVTRAAYKLNRGSVAGTNQPFYPYQSSSTGTSPATMNMPVDIHCTGLGANTYTSPLPVVYDAATNGTLLGVWPNNMLSTKVAQVINGDVVRVSEETYSNAASYGWYYTDIIIDTPTGTDYKAQFAADTYTPIVGAFVYGMVVDWLFRGFDSFNQMFPVSTYPNIWLAIQNYSGADYAAIPRIAIPRTTGSWSVPADASPGNKILRKITNSNTVSCVTTQSVNLSYFYISFRLSNVPQAFNDQICRIYRNVPLVAAAGDTITFAPGALDVVWG
jgi:hypothetical protein